MGDQGPGPVVSLTEAPAAAAVRPQEVGRRRTPQHLVLHPHPRPKSLSPQEAPVSYPAFYPVLGLGRSLLHPVCPHLWGMRADPEPLLPSTRSDQARQALLTPVPQEQGPAGCPHGCPSVRHRAQHAVGA